MVVCAYLFMNSSATFEEIIEFLSHCELKQSGTLTELFEKMNTNLCVYKSPKLKEIK